jgi:hypothetical protein
MIDGIHGTQPIRWQLDRAIARAEEMGRPIVRIRAAKPFVENLRAELEHMLTHKDAPGLMRYCGIVIETYPKADTGWAAYDKDDVRIDGLNAS